MLNSERREFLSFGTIKWKSPRMHSSNPGELRLQAALPTLDVDGVTVAKVLIEISVERLSHGQANGMRIKLSEACIIAHCAFRGMQPSVAKVHVSC